MNQLSMIPVQSEEQIETLSKLAVEIWNQHFVPIIGQAQVDYMLNKFLSPKALAEQISSGYEYFLVSSDNSFVGFTGIHDENGSLFLSKLYVHISARGKGIASWVFQELVKICKTRNLGKIWLTCNRYNSNTLAIYDHLGFEIVREEAADIGNGFVMDDYILEYKI
jgi:ribosomal protein S18 acetylase RimI-like enzyme